MRRTPILSICVPTYNRRDLMQVLIRSICQPGAESVELVIADDGSSDGTAELIASLRDELPFGVSYDWQPNAGRATALRRSLLAAGGEYLVIMDSDDYFLPDAITLMLREIENLGRRQAAGQKRLAGAVFNAVTTEGQPIGSDFPSDGMVSNLLQIRADHGVLGDKKEIIRSDVVRACIYDVPPGERRVPTSLLWARVADRCDCTFRNIPVVAKMYLPAGMTGNIARLKAESPRAMIAVHARRARSLRYRSIGYRLRSVAALLHYSVVFVRRHFLKAG